jgi:hypothetical protein
MAGRAGVLGADADRAPLPASAAARSSRPRLAGRRADRRWRGPTAPTAGKTNRWAQASSLMVEDVRHLQTTTAGVRPLSPIQAATADSAGALSEPTATRQLQSSLRLSPAVDESRQVVPTSDMRGLRGAGPARCWMASGYWHQQKPPGSSVSRCEPLNPLLPAGRQRPPTEDGSWGGQEREDRRATCLTGRSAVTRQQASGPWWPRPAARTSKEPG